MDYDINKPMHYHIKVTPAELFIITQILKDKARDDRERSVLLLKGLLGVPHNDNHPKRDLARAFLEQVNVLLNLAEKLEDQI